MYIQSYIVASLLDILDDTYYHTAFIFEFCFNIIYIYINIYIYIYQSHNHKWSNISQLQAIYALYRIVSCTFVYIYIYLIYIYISYIYIYIYKYIYIYTYIYIYIQRESKNFISLLLQYIYMLNSSEFICFNIDIT